ncbi:MAG: DUF3105 domain-containing protein [Nocardioides sp.]
MTSPEEPEEPRDDGDAREDGDARDDGDDRDDRRSVLPLVLAVGVALVVVVGALAVSSFAGRANLDADLSEVVVVEKPTSRHTESEVTYDQTPPAGGDHDPTWLECGVYDRPVREENAVHSLEHGTVWVTYRPGLDEAGVATLAAAVPDEAIVSPYDGLSSAVVVTVWGAQLALTGPDDPRLALFLTEYGDGHTSPEPSASCAGGVARADSETVGA